MTSPIPEDLSAKLILRGIHLNLTDAMKAAMHEKASRLLRHEPRIDRIRIDVELDKTRSALSHFVAKGHIEIGGPDIVASVDSDDAYKSVISSWTNSTASCASATASSRKSATTRTPWSSARPCPRPSDRREKGRSPALFAHDAAGFSPPRFFRPPPGENSLGTRVHLD